MGIMLLYMREDSLTRILWRMMIRRLFGRHCMFRMLAAVGWWVCRVFALTLDSFGLALMATWEREYRKAGWVMSSM